MNGEEFWFKMDLILKEKKMSLTDLAEATGIGRSTIYRQRERKQLPKMKDFQKFERYLDVLLLETQQAEETFTVSDHEKIIIIKYRELDKSVQDAIDRMLGIEKNSGESTSRVG